MRQDKHFRLPEDTIGKLSDLVIPGRRTMTDAVIIAVDLLHGRAAHDDAVDLLVDELRGLRQQAEEQGGKLAAMADQVQSFAAVAAAVAGLEQSIDRLGAHQLQLAQALNERLSPADQSGGFFGRKRA